jgi:hypothetical protein
MSEGTVTVDPKVAERIERKVGSEPLTMYRLANVWSDIIGTRVREQQAYNYRKNGLIKVNAEGRVLPADAVAFLLKRVQSK